MSDEQTTSENTSLQVKPDESIIQALKAGSGENTESLPFVPLIVVDNSKVKEMISEGREVDVLCSPRYKRTDKINDEYKDTFIDSFNGVVLTMKWQVYNKGKWDDATKQYIDNGAPFFASRLFSPIVLFGHKTFAIKYSDGTTDVLTYPELKAKYPNLFKLEAIWFVQYGDEIVRVKFRGASRTVIFDFLKTFPSNDSISAHVTKFGATYIAKPQPHNVSTLEINDEVNIKIDWNKIIENQAEINKLFNSAVDQAIDVVGGREVTQDELEPETIDVEAIPFK